jgi:hypothetical protein
MFYEMSQKMTLFTNEKKIRVWAAPRAMMVKLNNMIPIPLFVIKSLQEVSERGF